MAKILAIDDDPDLLFTIRTTFEVAGHEVVATSEPRDLLGLAESEDPDAVVLDVMMPGIAGWDLLAALRQNPQLRSVPVLMLTALDDAPCRVMGLRQGADDYLVKPFHPDELLIRVEKLAERHARDRESMAAAPGSGNPSGPTPGLRDAIALLERRIRQNQDLGTARLGRYEVQELLGEGAMGTVFRGWEPKLERPVALKTLLIGEVDEDREVQACRWLGEAVTGARFNHPNIVTVYDVGDEGNAAFIAIELVDGTSLQELLEGHSLNPGLVIPLAAAMARGLAAAHENDLIHRDVKPGNVLLSSDNSIKLTDFGMSELVSKSSCPDKIIGTAGYIAPECLEGEKACERTDLFALGAMLYECFTGTHPFRGHNLEVTLHNTMKLDPLPLAEVCTGVPPRAGEMVDRLIAKDREQRPASSVEVADLFEQLCDADCLSRSYNAARRRRHIPVAPQPRIVTLGFESADA